MVARLVASAYFANHLAVLGALSIGALVIVMAAVLALTGGDTPNPFDALAALMPGQPVPNTAQCDHEFRYHPEQPIYCHTSQKHPLGRVNLVVSGGKIQALYLGLDDEQLLGNFFGWYGPPLRRLGMWQSTYCWPSVCAYVRRGGTARLLSPVYYVAFRDPAPFTGSNS